MNPMAFIAAGGRSLRGALAALALAGWLAGSASAQTGAPSLATQPSLPVVATGLPSDSVIQADNKAGTNSTSGVTTADKGVDGGSVIPAGCASCGGGLLSPLPPPSTDGSCGAGGCSSCDGCACNCYPGRKRCYCDGDCGNFLGRFVECICCPDPCYEPRWIAAADQAFFMDNARPVNQVRIGFMGGYGMRNPDRSEWFWAGRGVKGPSAVGNPATVDYSNIYMINEVATERFSLTITPLMYRSYRVDPALGCPITPAGPSCPNPIPGSQLAGASGFGDIYIGVKTMHLDCDLMQVSTQLKTWIPSGNFLKGLGNGHASLEPSLLINLKLAPDCYLQSQIAEWIPLGGDDPYQGGILHYHLSANTVLWRPSKAVQLVGDIEMAGWTYQSGAFTAANPLSGPPDPVTGAVTPCCTGPGVFQGTSGATYINVGPGVRLVVCDKIDFGVAFSQAIVGTDIQLKQTYAFEFRWRF